jgi:hypothetical protein
MTERDHNALTALNAAIAAASRGEMPRVERVGIDAIAYAKDADGYALAKAATGRKVQMRRA